MIIIESKSVQYYYLYSTVMYVVQYAYTHSDDDGLIRTKTLHKPKLSPIKKYLRAKNVQTVKFCSHFLQLVDLQSFIFFVQLALFCVVDC